jgi:chromosome segregation ATPase
MSSVYDRLQKAIAENNANFSSLQINSQYYNTELITQFQGIRKRIDQIIVSINELNGLIVELKSEIGLKDEYIKYTERTIQELSTQIDMSHREEQQLRGKIAEKSLESEAIIKGSQEQFRQATEAYEQQINQMQSKGGLNSQLLQKANEKKDEQFQQISDRLSKELEEKNQEIAELNGHLSELQSEIQIFEQRQNQRVQELRGLQDQNRALTASLQDYEELMENAILALSNINGVVLNDRTIPDQNVQGIHQALEELERRIALMKQTHFTSSSSGSSGRFQNAAKNVMRSQGGVNAFSGASSSSNLFGELPMQPQPPSLKTVARSLGGLTQKPSTSASVATSSEEPSFFNNLFGTTENEPASVSSQPNPFTEYGLPGNASSSSVSSNTQEVSTPFQKH